MSRALEIAETILEMGNGSDNPAGLDQLSLGEGLFMRAEVKNIESDLMTELDHAVEIAPIPRRGRPPSRK